MNIIELRGACKRYRRFARPADRLIEVVTGRSHHEETIALEPVDLAVSQGEVVGVIGLNGAGKSTLLKLIAGTLSPTAGQVNVHGRLSALLELGTGFHPAMSARENVMLSCAAGGISLARARALYEDIVAFSGLSHASMAQPIKTFSSGMVARLAFSVATALEPEILIVDELLSVGDGIFARKSFDRIMQFKRAGKTMLFCSHSMYHVESICSRVVWLHAGAVRMEGEPAEVVVAYNAYLSSMAEGASDNRTAVARDKQEADHQAGGHAPARLTGVRVVADAVAGHELSVTSGVTDVKVAVRFASSTSIPCPSAGVRISDANGRTVASMGTVNDGVPLERDMRGEGEVELTLPAFPLLKGRYWINVLLLSEDGIHVYDSARLVAELKVEQVGLEQGLVSLPRRWAAAQAGAAAPVDTRPIAPGKVR
jgi:lipopolysaccharide transport system ATP-binding protein